MNIWMYDFEVYSGANFWCVVIINYNTKEKIIIQNNNEELRNFYDKYKEDIFVGYNSRMYDQWILKGLLLNKDPYVINNSLINEGKSGYQIIKNANKIPLNNFDISTGFHSLKQLEGFMGSRIKETSIPFDINRELTEDEKLEIIDYCTHDVEQTIEVFNYRKEEFDSQLSLIEAFNLPMEMFNKTKAQLSAYVLGTVKQDTVDDEFNFTFPDTLVLDKYRYVLEWYKNPRNLTYSRKLDTLVAGVPHTFAFGGIHGAKENYIAEGIILCADVGSMYPAIMIEYGFLSRNVVNHKKYTEIRDTRLKLKKKKDKRQLPYKIVLNSTYGASKDKNNPLYDPLMANNVCITGQLLILDLIEKIEPYCELLQSNTDGIFIKVDSWEMADKVKSIASEWEKRTRLDLEWESFTKCIQKDVNNYIIFHEDESYKSKGAYVKQLKEIDRDLPIVNTALINYFANGTPVEETINNCDELIQFQKIVKVSGLYKYALYGEKQLEERVLRVFASTQDDAKGVFKVKNENRIEKIANTPDKCFIDNEKITNKKAPYYLDKQYYIDLAKQRIEDFINVKKTNIKITPKQQIIEILNKNHKTFYDVLVDLKDNSNIGNVTLIKFIKTDLFKQYGKVNKILKFVEYFKVLYGKKNPKQTTLEKVINSERIFELLKNNSEFDNGEKINKRTGQVEKKVPTYKNLNYEKALKEIWNVIPNEDISVYEKIKQELDLYNDVTIKDSTVDKSELYILAMNQTKNPSVIAYCINNGVTQFLKVQKDLFKILEIREGDIIKAKGYDKKKCSSVIGKDNNGINIQGEDPTRYEWWLTSYEIIHRDYNKNGKLIIDEELE